MKFKELSKKEQGRVAKGFFNALADFLEQEDMSEDFEAFLDDHARDYGFRFASDGIALVADRDSERRDRTDRRDRRDRD